MDAHLFRLYARELAPLLQGARLEKIQEPAPGLLSFSIYCQSGKKQFYCRFGRQDPFCFMGEDRLAAPASPSAQVMRLRRYFGQRRIASVVPQFISRKLWLLASGEIEDRPGKGAWLCLDLARGPQLHFLDHNEAPEEETPAWPQPGAGAEALADWRAWPILTPALRKTLQLLEEPDQWALIQDLQAGGGDAFLYANGQDRIVQASAWPLPRELAKGREICLENVSEAINRAGADLVLAKIHDRNAERLYAPAQRRLRQLNKILEKLGADQARLEKMLSREKDAQALKASLWRWPRDLRAESVQAEGENGPLTIPLDRRFDVRENMERLFHQTRRARRGLKMVEQRRADVLQEIAGIGAISFSEQQSPTQKTTAPAPDRLAAVRAMLPKNVQAFLSSGGFILLRGRDAGGNRAMRRLASPRDYWVHVETGPGAHVIIRRENPGLPVPETTLAEAGSLAACKSWLKDSATASVMYAELRHVKPARKGPAGKVVIDKIQFTRLVAVNPDWEKDQS